MEENTPKKFTEDLMKRLKSDDDLVYAIAKGLKKRFGTITRWIYNNDEMLTSLAVVLVIKDATGMTDEEIFETPPQTQLA